MMGNESPTLSILHRPRDTVIGRGAVNARAARLAPAAALNPARAVRPYPGGAAYRSSEPNVHLQGGAQLAVSPLQDLFYVLTTPSPPGPR
jgi:hypothetical protein